MLCSFDCSIFTHTDTDLIKLDEEGNEVSRIPMLPSSNDEVRSITINEFNSEILFAVTVVSNGLLNHVAYTLNSKDVLSTLGCKNYSPALMNSNSIYYSQYVKTDDPCSPFLFFCDSDKCTVIPLVNVGYLATINNLQLPSTKTPAQTMKITYEIYDE